MRFGTEGAGTRVDLVHTGWERRGAGAQNMAQGYTYGWDTVLSHYPNKMSEAV